MNLNKTSKYVDIQSIIQVIGNVFKNPSILNDEEKYSITEDDFSDNFHKIIFGVIYNLWQQGVEKITLNNIIDYLSTRPKSKAVYEANNGSEWLLRVSENILPQSFDYYYNRMKKFTLLRAYDNYGIDVTDIYDVDNIFDLEKKQRQEDLLDNSTVAQIAQKVDEKIESIKAKYLDEDVNESFQAGSGALELIQKLKNEPEVGIPLYGPIINTVTRGARLKKLYLRSAPTGTGKTRTMIADICYIGCSKIYDDYFGWIKTGKALPSLYISTEQEKEEIQTMMLAFISNVSEDHILNGRYEGDEEDRVIQAAKILSESKVIVECLPDFSLKDVENIIKRHIRENDVSYIAFDYIQTSLKILEEISKRSGGVKLREDNILFMLSRRLKDLANRYGVFILTSTQLNGSWKQEEIPDQNLLRGAKAIADSVDLGLILLPVSKDDLENLKSVLSSNTFKTPNIKISVYKNRRGKYKGIFLWCNADLGTCRVNPMFCTDFGYNLVKVDDLHINVDDEGAF